MRDFEHWLEPQMADGEDLSLLAGEVASCLERVRTYLAKTEEGGEGLSAGKIAIVTRNSGEFLTILQEARRLGLLDRLRIEPRLPLLTPLGRFALSPYELNPSGRLEITAERFETMLASGWLGAAVQQTVHLFAAVRPQAFDHCKTVADWNSAIAQLAATDQSAPELARLTGIGVGPTQIETWRQALKQVVDLQARLFDNRPRSIAEHIRRLGTSYLGSTICGRTRRNWSNPSSMIYGFRGAGLSLEQLALQKTGQPPLRLSISRRPPEHLLKAYNALFASMSQPVAAFRGAQRYPEVG